MSCTSYSTVIMLETIVADANDDDDDGDGDDDNVDVDVDQQNMMGVVRRC